MSYELSLEKAGAKILSFKEFGSYQGTWLAFVEYNGQKGIVEGDYGSCSGCDRFHAEFNYSDCPTKDEGKFYKNNNTWEDENECTEEEYNKLIVEYDLRLADFGRSYLGELYTKDHYVRKLSNLNNEDCFDEEEREYCQWAIDKFNEHINQ